jgi:TonB family protein
MSLERRCVPAANLGCLRGCLVEGDADQRMRERDVRRRALVISVVVQSTVLATLILVPLFGKPARIALANVIPLPPYSGGGPRHAPDPARAQRANPPRPICRPCTFTAISPTIVTRDPQPTGNNMDDSPFTGPGPTIPGGIQLADSPDGIRPPRPVENRPERPTVVRLTHLDPAMLVHRVEPLYPTLARQIGRAGRVDLRAIIATDGMIQSLQVVGGDPLFYSSALDAVRQWRYTPTVLNGEAVQVDTYITVIYSMQR